MARRTLDNWTNGHSYADEIRKIKKLKSKEDFLKWHIESLADDVVWRNLIEANEYGLDLQYDTLFEQIKRALGDVPGIRLLRRYEKLLDDDVLFYNPYDAYLAGREYGITLRFDNLIPRDKLYQCYIKRIRETPEYKKTIGEQQVLFEQIMDLLKVNEDWQMTFISWGQLHSDIYGIMKKKLRIFFDLGYEGCCNLTDYHCMAKIFF